LKGQLTAMRAHTPPAVLHRGCLPSTKPAQAPTGRGGPPAKAAKLQISLGRAEGGRIKASNDRGWES
jgi:hypothetical protein